MVPGRSKKVLKTWLAARGESWRGRVEVVAMDGFTGFKSATGEELPQARAVMDPFHVVSLAASKLDQCRRRIQRAITGRRGRAGDRLYRAQRTGLPGVFRTLLVFLLQAAFVKFRSSRSTSLGARYPRAE